MNNKIILTATIDTGVCPNLQRKDIDQRLDDYKKTLEKYLRNTDLKILFVENSNQNCEELFKDLIQKHTNRVEFISFDGNQTSFSKGKGHGEKISILYALNNSKLYTNELFFYKVSGRYYSPDIQKFIKKIDTTNFLTVNRKKHNQNHILTVFFGSNIEKFKNFFTNLDISDNFNIIENAFGCFVDSLPQDKVYWLPELIYEDTICSNNIPFLKG